MDAVHLLLQKTLLREKTVNENYSAIRWYHVKHIPSVHQSNAVCWLHPARDYFKGIETYGNPTDYRSPWSVKFDVQKAIYHLNDKKDEEKERAMAKQDSIFNLREKS